MSWNVASYVCMGLSVVVLAVGLLAALRLDVKGRRMRTVWMARAPMSEEAFLSACGIPAEGMEQRIGKWMREDLAAVACVPADKLRPDDRFGEPLFFDMSLLDFEYDVKKTFRIELDREALERYLREAGVWRPEPCELRHLIKAVALGAANGNPVSKV